MAHVKDTVLHEIAHALAGHEAKHGPVWQKIAKEIGANGQRVTKDKGTFADAKYLFVCGEGDDVCKYGYVRKPGRYDAYKDGKFKCRKHTRIIYLKE